jgi:hypothetical protein
MMEGALGLLRNERPYLMFMTTVCLDVIAHDYTTHSPETQAALEVIDTQIGRLITLLREMNWYEDTLIVISSDHAMAAKPKCVSVMDELEKKGHDDIIENTLYILVGCGGGLYLRDTSPATIKRTIRAIRDIPHIEDAWYKHDPDAPWFIRRGAFDRAPDIAIVAQGDAGTVPAGSTAPTYSYRHGAPYPADANIMLVFSGAGVKKLGSIGERLDLSSHKLLTDNEVGNLPEQIDVAPTMKRIMGLPISSGEGNK